jgi:DedD protein
MASGRRRGGDGPGLGQWLALGTAVAVILGLTFALGLLVGRQLARQPGAPGASGVVVSASEAARRAAGPMRKSGIAQELMADRAPESTEKLTFYQTLTEPLNSPAPPRPEPKPVAIKTPAPAPAAPAPPAPPPPSLPPLAARPAEPPHPRTAEAAPSAPSTSAWTIQVGAYKNQRQAEDLRQQLAASGLEAYVATLPAKEGQARYRVRIGTYRTREEATAAAERVRAQRSLTAFVTVK